MIAVALTGWFVVVVPLRHDILDNDLTFVYIGARIGLEQGWSHIYSLGLQHDLFLQLRPHGDFNDGARFISPPPFAWLVLPLTLLGAAGAVYAWLTISVASLVAAWWIAAPGEWRERGLWLLAALAWYPVLYSLSLAQQLTLLLPLVLLVSGRWKVAVAWAATASFLAVASLAVIGGQGLSDYLSLLDEAQHVVNNRYFTFAYLLGPGFLSYVAQAIIIAVAIVAAYLNRRASHARLFALGLVATAVGATYWHLQDYAILVLAAWLFWRERPRASLRWLLLLIVIAGEFAWPLTPLPMLIGIAVWLAALATPPRTAQVAT